MAMAETASRAEILRRRLSSSGSGNIRSSRLSSTGNRAASVVAAPHSNSLIVIGSAAQVKSLRELITKMDVDVPSGRGRLNAIFLRHLVAEEAAENIGALLAKKKAGKKTPAEFRDIAIQASPASNALLVDASPGDFEIVKRLIEQLDQPPEQVHINVLIMEVSNSDGFEFGIDMAAVDMPSAVGDSVVQGAFSLTDGAGGLLNSIQSGIFPNGLSVGVAHGTSLAADGTVQVGYPGLVNITALKKNKNFKVVSETSLQSQNNKEASVSVVNEIPVLTSEIQGGSGTSRDVIQNIERIDVGVKLKITPHVIPGGRVRMALNPSIEAVIDNGPEGTQFTPTIARRQVETTVTVDDGRTIVIAGLTRQDKRESENRVPILGSIPILGWLFRHKETITERTDVLILVTPTIVSDAASADSMRQHWENKTGLDNNAGK
jgi:general secretion pathway protein D